MRKLVIAGFFVGSLMSVSEAHAYVGPGLGLGAIGVLVGILLSVALAVVGLFWYPIKRVLRRLKAKRKPSVPPSTDGVDEPDDTP